MTITNKVQIPWKPTARTVYGLYNKVKTAGVPIPETFEAAVKEYGGQVGLFDFLVEADHYIMSKNYGGGGFFEGFVPRNPEFKFKNPLVNYRKKMLRTNNMMGYGRFRGKGLQSSRPSGKPRRSQKSSSLVTKKTSNDKGGKTNRKNKGNRKAKKAPKNSIVGINQQIQELRSKVHIPLAKHTYKSVDTVQVLNSIGRCYHQAINGCTLSKLETSLANLRYLDAATNALVTASAVSGTYSRDFQIKNYYMKLHLRNNFMVPVKVKVYLCTVKTDTSTGVKTAYEDAITDQVINASVDSTDQLIYLSDIERIKETWNIDCVADKHLHNGEEFDVSHSTGSFQYDPSHGDSESETYQKALKSFEWIVRVEGTLAHDTVANERTIQDAGVDVMYYTKVDVLYNAGASLNDIYINETRPQVFTTAGRTGLKYSTDNVAIDRT